MTTEAAIRAQNERWRRAEAHGVENVLYDNLGEGWRFYCLCGFISCPCKRLADAGEEMDDHLEMMKP